MKNTTIAQQYLKAAYGNEIEKAKSYLSDDIILSMGGNNALAGVYNGKDAFMGAFGKMLEMTNYTYTMKEAVEWLEGKERAMLVTIEQAEKDGETHTFQRVVDYKIKGDKITEITIYEGQPEIVDTIFK